MELALVFSRALVGLDAPLVRVEVHLANGLPAFHIVGMPETSVRESRERVRAALPNSHFEFPDRSRMDRAFSYYWRLWTLPEIREMLAEAGFSEITVYWEGTDQESNEGNGIYEPAEVGDADPGWVCYVVAQR